MHPFIRAYRNLRTEERVAMIQQVLNELYQQHEGEYNELIEWMGD